MQVSIDLRFVFDVGTDDFSEAVRLVQDIIDQTNHEVPETETVQLIDVYEANIRVETQLAE